MAPEFCNYRLDLATQEKTKKKKTDHRWVERHNQQPVNLYKGERSSTCTADIPLLSKLMSNRISCQWITSFWSIIVRVQGCPRSGIMKGLNKKFSQRSDVILQENNSKCGVRVNTHKVQLLTRQNQWSPAPLCVM